MKTAETEPTDETQVTDDILLVDDCSAHAELVDRCLRRMGSSVRTAHMPDGESALAYLDEKPTAQLPSLVLLDLRLPRMDGLEVLRAIRSSDRYAALPVLMLSSSDAESDVQAAYEAQVNSYLIKPVGIRDLEDLLHAVIGYWLGHNQPSPILQQQPTRD